MTRIFSVPSLLLAALPTLAAAQSPADIVDRMLDAYERNTASVENYTVVQEVMGLESELYFEKVMRDGRPVFELRGSSSGGISADIEDDFGYSDVYAAGPQIAEHGRYGGTERVGGEEVHVLLIDDLGALDLVPETGPRESGFEPRTGRILVDTDLWVPRRMEFTGDLDTGDGPVEVTSFIDLEDYRDEGGLLMPHRTVVRMEGLGAAIGPEMRAEYEEMRRQLEGLPEGQREMVEQMFGGQMEQMEALMGGEDGTMTVEMRVLEVRVNQGPPRR